MLLLNVGFFVIGGLLGFMVLRRATRTMLHRSPVVTPGTEGAPPPLPARAADQARRVLAVWTFVYGVVGAQMGWLLRPFLGSPHLPFEWFRPREDNVLIAVLRTIRDLFHP